MKPTKKIKVSIIIPTYNRKNFLNKAISSVACQTYQNFEILVIDDGSKENYAESICNKYESCFYYYKKNGGLSSARNFGIQKAKGEYIAFLDDDDFWRKDKLEKQVNVLESQKDISCVHSSAQVVNELGNTTGKIIGASKNKVHKRSGNVFWNALGVWVVKSPTPLIRKSIFKDNMFFDESIQIGEDIDFYQRMFYKHKVYYINEPLAFYREYSDTDRLSLQVKKYLGIEKKIFKNFLKMDIKKPFTLNRIASKLLICGVNRFNSIYTNNVIKLSFFDKYIFPQKKLKTLKLKND
jgi:glycosyltransferase involved in cell wall biosynthesis